MQSDDSVREGVPALRWSHPTEIPSVANNLESPAAVACDKQRAGTPMQCDDGVREGVPALRWSPPTESPSV
ncbi:MAG: hypothetical protein ACK50J_28480, partial [Planctomyces sp.]